MSLGNKELIFVEAAMLHWPDTMFCYLTQDNILFSNDAFGQHYATEYMFNDLVDQSELLEESGFDVVDEGLKVTWNPDDASITKCAEFGKQIARL